MLSYLRNGALVHALEEVEVVRLAVVALLVRVAGEALLVVVQGGLACVAALARLLDRREGALRILVRPAQGEREMSEEQKRS